MPKKAVNELGGRKRDMPDLLRLVVAVAKTDDAVDQRFQTTVGDGDAENVAGKIVQHLVASSSVLGMNDPANLPDVGWNESKQPCLFQTGTELGAEDRRQSGIGNEKAWMFGIDPGITILILREASGGDEHVDVRMEQHGARPGVKDGQSAHAGAKERRIAGQSLKAIGSGLHQQTVDPFGMGASKRTQLRRKGEGHQEIGTR